MDKILKIAPARLLLFGFLAVIIIGTAGLLTPFAHNGELSVVDAIYTATSATCVTGLIVKDTPNDFTLFGQLWILLLIQIGGLGYMSLGTFLALLVGRRIGLGGQVLLRESLNLDSLDGLVKLIRGVMIFVICTELTGAVLLTFRFAQDYPLRHAILQAVFHSVSAFNNAGFSLFRDNLMGYRGDILVNVVIMCLIIIGGLGFIVVADLFWRVRGSRPRILSHTRVVIKTTLLLIIGGAIAIYFCERVWLFSTPGFGAKDTVLTSFFASVTPRTAGYNTVDYGLLQQTTLFVTMILMFIGASPGGTGGGVKTTTFTVVMAYLMSTLKGQRDTNLFLRRVPERVIARAFVIMTLSVLFVSLVSMVIVAAEGSELQKTMFEVISAFGTVGLSTGNGSILSLSANFSDFSKIMVILTMLAGRLGPLTLFMALVRQKEEKAHYPEGRIFVG